MLWFSRLDSSSDLPLCLFQPSLRFFTMIPVELYRYIVLHFGKRSDLCALARVSRSFQFEAERQIYRSLEVVGADFEPNRSRFTWQKTIKSVDMIALSTPRRLYVRTLNISTNIEEHFTPDHIIPFLRTLPNLLHLILSVHIPDTSFATFPIDFPFRLSTFEVGLGNDEHYFAPFLLSQPSITTLILQSGGKFHPQPSTSDSNEAISFLPNLDTLYCEWYNADLILNRPVRRLWMVYLSPSESWPQNISEGCFPSVLSLNIHVPPPSGNLALIFPRLEYLSISRTVSQE